jgi:hypothetical protein
MHMPLHAYALHKCSGLLLQALKHGVDVSRLLLLLLLGQLEDRLHAARQRKRGSMGPGMCAKDQTPKPLMSARATFQIHPTQ